MFASHDGDLPFWIAASFVPKVLFTYQGREENKISFFISYCCLCSFFFYLVQRKFLKKCHAKIILGGISCTRKSHQRWSIRKAVLKNFAIYWGKHLYWSLFLIKQQTFVQHWCFPVNIVNFLKNTCFEEYLRTAASLALHFFELLM